LQELSALAYCAEAQITEPKRSFGELVIDVKMPLELIFDEIKAIKEVSFKVRKS
jgi:hypothetical protein